MDQVTTPTVTMPAPLLERLVCVLERLEASAQRPEARSQKPEDLLTLQEVADLIPCSVRKVQILVRAGKLRKVPGLGAKTTRFKRAAVDEFLAGGEKPRRIGGRRL